MLVVQFRRGKLAGLIPRLGEPFDEAPEADTLEFSFARVGESPITVMVPYQEGAKINQIAAEPGAKISEALGINVLDTGLAPARDSEHQYYVYVRPEIGEIISSGTINDAVRFGNLEIDWRKFKSQEEMNLVGQAVKDEDASTVDVIVVRDNSLPDNNQQGTPFGVAKGDGASGYPGLQNTIFIVKSAADTSDDYPFVAAHEAGHVLFDSEFPGSHPVDNEDPSGFDLSHSDNPQNLMYPTSDQHGTDSGPKRLTQDQHNDARADSGPGSAGPLLLQSLSKTQE